MINIIPFIKYIFLAILLIFTFICLFTEKLENVGFGALFTVHVFYMFCLFFDIYKDKERARKVFTLPSVKVGTVDLAEFSFPLYLLLIPIATIHFRTVTLLSLNAWANVSKYGYLRTSRDNKSNIKMVKIISLITILFLFLITFLYIAYNSIQMNDLLRFAFAICIVGSFSLAIINMFMEMKVSNEFANTTDG